MEILLVKIGMVGHRHGSAPQSREGAPTLQATGLRSAGPASYTFHFGEKQRHRSLRVNVQKLLMVFLPALAILAVLVTCRRTLGFSRLFESAGRRLAGEEGKTEEDEEREAILKACLALEEELGLVQQTSSPLPDPQVAIPQIVEFLLPAPQSQPLLQMQPLAAPPQQQAPSPTLLALSGPSHVSPVYQGFESIAGERLST